ncbi:MAG TPA: lysylphosphatidylglycerol synthase transmembrane domain-containing protein [Roseiflexaceae bacterium]|nr:lysylphosphatidylglycerol synthase transmembrane domain-containing protein [Roseiflexaceae bacterium]HMP41727.1 lysylphosphatidylglycerol synthase transmembrane domain-containing protein [Roseiflexaceae bacterium]
MARNWKLWLGVVVSAVCLAIALNGLDLQNFWAIVSQANYWWLIPAIAVYFVAVWARTWRWQSLLRHLRPIAVNQLFPVVVIGYMGNNVYPARAGEVLRSYVLKRRAGVPISASLATVVLERIFDGLVMLLFVFVTLPFAPLPPVYTSIISVFSVLFLAALILFLALAARPARIGRLYARIVDRLVPEALRPQTHGLFNRFVEGLQSLRSPRELIVIFGSTVVIWLMETGKYWFVMHAFPFEVSFLVLMLMTAVVNLFTTLPSTPGYIGTFHVPGIAVLMAFGVDQAIATGYTVVLHVALWLPITALGGLYMLSEHLGWRDFSKATEEQSVEALR